MSLVWLMSHKSSVVKLRKYVFFHYFQNYSVLPLLFPTRSLSISLPPFLTVFISENIACSLACFLKKKTGLPIMHGLHVKKTGLPIMHGLHVLDALEPPQVYLVHRVDPLNLLARGVFILSNFTPCISLNKWESGNVFPPPSLDAGTIQHGCDLGSSAMLSAQLCTLCSQAL